MISKEEYKKLAEKKTKNSPIVKNTIKAFLIGGIICVIGQIIFAILKIYIENEKTAAAFLSVIMVFLGAFFTGIGIYDKLAKHAGAGSIIPITGFANSIVAAAMEFKSEGLVLGLAAKMFTIAGPVLVFGTIGSFICGIIYYIIYNFIQ